jgi:hypothetical protein
MILYRKDAKDAKKAISAQQKKLFAIFAPLR